MVRSTAAPDVDALRPLIPPADRPDQRVRRAPGSIGDARIVLLGEASHGTHEFYRERARITRRLIEERGFTAVAVEADWPDAYRINRWVRGTGDDGSPIGALDGFDRFPRWMWRNRDVLQFIADLREHNDAVSRPGGRVGFYGLDLYSLFSSIEAVLRYLDEVDPESARRTPRPTATPQVSACLLRARTTPCSNCTSCSGGRWTCRSGMGRFQRTSSSSRSRTPVW